MTTSPIRYAQIFGERCSGTNYLRALVQHNWSGVEITDAFGGKHWFIDGVEPRGPGNETTDRQCQRRLDDATDTVFLVITRNPVDWLRSLHQRPYHAPRHSGLPFDEFLTAPWISYETTRVNPQWPLRGDEYYFIEEAENVLALRAQKIAHFQQLTELVPHVAYISYEELVDDLEMLGRIGDGFGIQRTHPTMQNLDRHFGRTTSEPFDPARRQSVISDADRDIIISGLNWELERLMGYRPNGSRNM